MNTTARRWGLRRSFSALVAAGILTACEAAAPPEVPVESHPAMEEALAHSKAFWTALARDDWHASHSVLSRRGLTTLTLEEYVTEKWPERLRYELERELCDLRIEGSEARLIYAALSTFTPTGCAIGPNYHGPGTFRLPRVLEERWVRAGEGWELAYWGPPPEDLDPPCDPTALLTSLER